MASLVTTTIAGSLTTSAAINDDWIASFANTNASGWGTFLKGGGANNGDYSLLIRNQADTDLLKIMGDGAATFSGAVGVTGNFGIGMTPNSGTSPLVINNSASDYLVGLYRGTVSEWWFKVYANGNFAIHENGVGDKFTIAAGGAATFAGALTVSGTALFSDGLVGSPSISFAGDTDTGIWRPGSNQLWFVTTGVNRLKIDGSGNTEVTGALTGTSATFSGVLGVGSAPDSAYSVDITRLSATSNNVLLRVKNTTLNEDAGLVIEGSVSGSATEYRIGVLTAILTTDLTFSGPSGYRHVVAGNTISTISSTGLAVTGTGTFSGALTAGTTTSIGQQVFVQGSANSGEGATVTFKRTTTTAGHIGTEGGILGTVVHSNNMCIFGVGNNVSIYGGNQATNFSTFTSSGLAVTGTGTFSGALTIGAYTLPNTDGTTGYHLQTNGSGTVTWQPGGGGTVTGSGTDNYIPRWNGTTALHNSIIYDSGASVGISSVAFNSPAGTLHTQAVGGNITYLDAYSLTDGTGSLMIFRKSASATVGKTQTGNGDSLGTFTFYGVNSDASPDWALGAGINVSQEGVSGGTYVPAHMAFATCTASAYGERMRITSAGFVGIGTASPDCTLHIEKLTGGTDVRISAGNYGTNYGGLSLDSVSFGISSGNSVRALGFLHTNQNATFSGSVTVEGDDTDVENLYVNQDASFNGSIFQPVQIVNNLSGYNGANGWNTFWQEQNGWSNSGSAYTFWIKLGTVTRTAVNAYADFVAYVDIYGDDDVQNGLDQFYFKLSTTPNVSSIAFVGRNGSFSANRLSKVKVIRTSTNANPTTGTVTWDIWMKLNTGWLNSFLLKWNYGYGASQFSVAFTRNQSEVTSEPSGEDNKTEDDFTNTTFFAGKAKVGIGTTAPGTYTSVAANLEVKTSGHGGIAINSGAASLGMLAFVQNGTHKWSLECQNNATPYISFNEAGTQRLTIANGGNVGIGTTAPGAKLDVNGSAIVRGTLHFDSTSSSFIDNVSSKIKIGGDAGVGLWTYVGGWQERLTIADGGAVGINDTAPPRRLSVTGEDGAYSGQSSGNSRTHLLLENNAANYIEFLNPSNVNAGIFWSTNTAQNSAAILHDSSGALYFQTGGVANRLRIVADGSAIFSGNVSITRTTTALLTIQGASSGYVNAGVVLKATDSSNYRGLGVFMHDAGGDTEWYAGRPYATSDQYIIARKATQASHDEAVAQVVNALFTIKNSGSVGIGTTSPARKLEVYGDTSNWCANFRCPTDGYGVTIGNRLAAGTGYAAHLYWTGGDAGYFTIQPYSYTNSSSRDLVLCPSSGNVGINDTTPTYKLDVNGTLRVTDQSTNIGARLGQTRGGSSTAGEELALYGGQNQGQYPILSIAINNSDTTNPAKTGISLYNAVASGNTTPGAYSPSIAFSAMEDTGSGYIYNSQYASIIGQQKGESINADWQGGDLTFWTRDVGNTGNYNLQERFRISNNGNCGIGTNAPSTTLHIRGATQDSGKLLIESGTLSNNNRATLFMSSVNVNGNTGNVSIECIHPNNQQSELVMRTGATDATTFGTERIRITTDGNVGIGTDNPGELLQVKGNMTLRGATNLRYKIANDSNNNWAEIGNDGATSQNTLEFFTGSSATASMSIKNDGSIYTASSVTIANGFYFGALNAAGGTVALMSLNSSDEMVLGSSDLTSSADPVRLMAKYIAFEPAGILNIPIETMRVTNGSLNGVGSVGIGNTAPTTNLEISQSAGTPTLMVSTWSTTDGESSQLSFQKSSSATINTKAVTANNESLGDISVYGIDTNANQRRAAQIKFEQDAASTGSKVAGRIIFKTSSNGTNDVEHVRIQSNGYIGIGTTSADAKVHIEKDTNAFFFGLNIENPNVGSSAATGLYLNCGGKTLDLRVKNALSGNVGYINSSGTLYTSINHDGGVCLVAKGGNVGIGTTSPGVRLDVRGVGNTSQNFFEIKDSDGAGQLLVASDGGGDCYLQVHDTNGAAKVVIHGGGITYFNGGNFGIGTATPGSYKLYVNGNTWVQGSLETSGQLKAGTSLALGSSGSGGYTLPAADGTNGYVLKTNGSGTVAWAADSGGGGTVTSVATTGAITGGTITTTGTIAHSTSAGYKHVPTGGSSKQYLKYSSSGTAVWSTLAWEDLPDISTLTALP